MPTERELQAIDRYLEPKEEQEMIDLNEDVVDFYGNKIQADDGVYGVVDNVMDFKRKRCDKRSSILTHDTLTDFMQDEVESYEIIEYLGLGEEYVKEVWENEGER